MVEIRAQVIDADRVHAENLHQGGIAKTVFLSAEGVEAFVGLVAARTTRLVGDADNLEAVACRGVDEGVVLDFQRRNCGSDSCAERQERRMNLDMVS